METKLKQIIYGIGLRQAAKQCGVPLTTMYRLANEWGVSPNSRTLKSVSEGLGIPMAEVLKLKSEVSD